MSMTTETTYTCKRCGDHTAVNPKQPHIRTCGRCLGELQKEGRAKATKKRSKKSNRTPRVCECCKVLFRPNYNGQRFCATSCSNKANSYKAVQARRAKHVEDSASARSTEPDAKTQNVRADLPPYDNASEKNKKRAKVAALVTERILLGIFVDSENMRKEFDDVSVVLDGLCDKVEALEKRAEMSPNVAAVDQAEAEFAYIKDSLRKLLAAVEDVGIKNTAIDARLTRLEKDLGVKP